MREQLHVVGMRHRERMMRGDRAAFVVESLEEREVDDPEEVQPTLVHRRAADLHPERAEHVVDEARRAGDHQDQVARFPAERVDEPELLALAQELRHR